MWLGCPSQNSGQRGSHGGRGTSFSVTYFSVLVWFVFCQERVSLCSSCCLGYSSADQAGLELNSFKACTTITCIEHLEVKMKKTVALV